MAGKKIVIVLPPHGFDRQVYETTRRALEGQGHEITTSCISSGAAYSGDGLYAPVTMRVHDIHYYMYDAFVFIGGPGAVNYFDNEYIIKLASDAKSKQLGATGNATVILARGQAIRNKRVTGDPVFADILIEAEAQYTNEPLEIDDKVVTLKDPRAAIYFANALSAALQ